MEKKKDSPVHVALAISIVLSIVLFMAFSSPKPRTESDIRADAVYYGSEAVKAALNDPHSVTWYAKKYNLDNNSLCYAFTARNEFGGVIKSAAAITDKGLTFKASEVMKVCSAKHAYENY